MKVSHPSKRNMRKAAKIIKGGGIVSFPTETVYGLGADAFNPLAVTKIFQAKNRPLFDPMIVHIADLSQMSKLAVNISIKAGRLAGRFWPGPLTMVLQKAAMVPDIVTSGLDTVAIRMPSHLIAIELIKRAKTPIAAPSANPFGYLSPTTSLHVLEQLGDKADMIIDGGECLVGLESTIIKIEEDRNVLLRYGGIPVEEIEDVIGKVEMPARRSGDPEAPGQLKAHYSPSVPVKLVENVREIDFSDKDAGYLLFKTPRMIFPFDRTEILSTRGDMVEAASKFFSAFHRLDKLNLKIIYAESVPDEGLGIAIMDRLKKASEDKS